jgi:peptidoglycan biosynthesis protein MviN/MurJ (putative lipid II flippase)
MLPGIFGSSVAQVSLLLDSIIASFFVVGSVTWLYSADRLVEFPMGVFSIALATVILPGLASHHSENDQAKFNATLDWALRLTLTVIVPAAIGLLMLSGPLIATFFGYGAFTHRDVLMCGYALMAYSFGLVGFSMVKVLAPGYYARQDTKTPVKVGLIALGINMGFNLTVVVPALLLGFPIPHILLAISTGSPRSSIRRSSIAACGAKASSSRRRPGESCCPGLRSQASPWPRSCGGSRATGKPGPAGPRRAGSSGWASPSSAAARCTSARWLSPACARGT